MFRSSERLCQVVVLAAIITATPVLRAQVTHAEVMTNASVIEMVAGSLPRDLIIAKVRSTSPGYDLTSTGLVQLTKARVHRSVVEAMMSMVQDARAKSGASSDEIMNNEDIARMVAGSVDDKLIYAKILNTKSTFDLTASGMVWLHNNKVDSDIIKAMMAPPPAPVSAAQLTIREPQQASTTEARASETAASASKTPTVVAPTASKPRAPLSPLPTEVGIHMRLAGNALMSLEKNQYQGVKTSNTFGSAITGGLSAAKIKAVITNPEAAIRTSDANVEFYFVFETSTTTLGRSAQTWGATLTSPNEFVLLRLDKHDTRREVTVASRSAFNAQSGTDDKDAVPFTFTRLKTGVYRVVTKTPLSPGEYAFFPSAGTAQGTAGSARLFDFGVDVSTGR